jgi:hypothetical protein
LAAALLYRSDMEALITQILETSKVQNKSLTARQVFFQEFDLLLAQGATQASLTRLDQYGRVAGISEVELAQRKSVLAYSLAQAA